MLTEHKARRVNSNEIEPFFKRTQSNKIELTKKFLQIERLCWLTMCVCTVLTLLQKTRNNILLVIEQCRTILNYIEPFQTQSKLFEAFSSSTMFDCSIIELTKGLSSILLDCRTQSNSIERLSSIKFDYRTFELTRQDKGIAIILQCPVSFP